LADILYLHQNRATQLLLLVQRALLLQALPWVLPPGACPSSSLHQCTTLLFQVYILISAVIFAGLFFLFEAVCWVSAIDLLSVTIWVCRMIATLYAQALVIRPKICSSLSVPSRLQVILLQSCSPLLRLQFFAVVSTSKENDPLCLQLCRSPWSRCSWCPSIHGSPCSRQSGWSLSHVPCTCSALPRVCLLLCKTDALRCLLSKNWDRRILEDHNSKAFSLESKNLKKAHTVMKMMKSHFDKRRRSQ
jgi:hypothetical protein